MSRTLALLCLLSLTAHKRTGLHVTLIGHPPSAALEKALTAGGAKVWFYKVIPEDRTDLQAEANRIGRGSLGSRVFFVQDARGRLLHAGKRPDDPAIRKAVAGARPGEPGPPWCWPTDGKTR